jgi:uncharacterized protein YuzE
MEKRMEVAYSVNGVPIRLNYERWYHIVENHDDMATIISKTTKDLISKCMAIASDMLKLPAGQVWLDYDKEADVLYMSFRKPQRATKTFEVDDNLLIRKDGRKIVGLTILNASTRG